MNALGKFSEAIAPLERARAITRISLPAVYAIIPAVIRQIAVAKQGIGAFDEAKARWEEVRDMFRANPQLVRDFSATDAEKKIAELEQMRLGAGK